MGVRAPHVFAGAAVVLALVARQGVASACENSVQLSADARIRTLQEAEAALDEGELERARDLAHVALRRRSATPPDSETAEGRLDQRASRVLALAYVRDPGGHQSAGFEEGMIGASPICRGDYPHPPLIRGTTRSYLPHALLALAALGYRLLRRRRLARGAVLADGRPAAAPWVGHAAPLQVLALLGGALYVFARAAYPTWTAFVFAGIVLSTFAVERRAFFAAVRRGLVAGLVLRAAGPDDAHLPSLALLRAPREAHTLEHEHGGGVQPGYREAARTPLLRLERRLIPDVVGFALATVLALIALVILLSIVLAVFTALGRVT